MPTQTETQRKAAFEAAGLTESQQAGVSAGTGYAPRYSRLPTPEAPEAPSYSSILETSRQSEIARQQEQLSAIETTFGEKLQRETAREKELGVRDVARSNTISAMTGMVGAPDAATREGNANRRTDDRVKLVEQQVAAEKASAIAAIYGRIDQNASEAAKIELQTKREDMDRLRGETAKNALNNVLAFAEQDNVDWNTFSRAYKDDPSLKSEVERTGKTLPEIYELYTSTQKAPPKKTYTWKGDNLVVVEERVDGTVGTQTFDAKDLGIPKGTDMQTLTLGDSVWWLDKNDPFNEDGSPKMTRLGAAASKGGGKKAEETPESIPTFDEFVDDFIQTPAGQQMINTLQTEKKMSLTPEARRQALATDERVKTAYDTAKAETISAGGGTDYDNARQIIESSGSKDWNLLRSKIMERTKKLSATEIDALLLAQGVTKPKSAGSTSDSSTMTDEEFMAFLQGK